MSLAQARYTAACKILVDATKIFVDEVRLSYLGLTLRDLAHFLESQPFLFAVFTNDDVRSAANALKPAPPPRHSKYEEKMSKK